MGAFTPFKRHAKSFNYVPRFYDPQKEAREQRRAELTGERLDDKGGEYRPGQYIQRQRSARSERGKRSGGQSRIRMWISVAFVIVVALMGSMLYTKIVEAFGLTEGSGTKSTPIYEYEEFNPHTPITIVPNDYDPSKETKESK